MYSIIPVPSTKKLLRCTAKAAASHNLTLHVQPCYNAVTETFRTYRPAAYSKLKLFVPLHYCSKYHSKQMFRAFPRQPLKCLCYEIKLR